MTRFIELIGRCADYLINVLIPLDDDEDEEEVDHYSNFLRMVVSLPESIEAIVRRTAT